MLQSLLVLIVKNEENDILEWICHHSLIGFQKIVIYDNESTDKTADVIKEASQYFPVEYVLWKDDMYPVIGLNKQGAAYTHAIEQYRNSTKWMCFLDGDEFLIPPENKKLDALLEQMSSYRSFALNWIIYGSSNLENTQGRLILEAFVLRAEYDFHPNHHVKMFFKPRFAKKVYNPHFIDVGEEAVNLNKEVIQWSTKGIVKKGTIVQSEWRLHHYIIRSQEHWKRRVARKQPGGHAREWETFKGHDRNDVVDYSAHISAIKVYNKLLELNKHYQPIPNIPNSKQSIPTIPITCYIVDEITPYKIKGWAYDESLNSAVELSFYINDVLIASTKCNLSRKDVKKTTINNEFVGFFCNLHFEYKKDHKYYLTIYDQNNNSVKFHVNGEQVDRYLLDTQNITTQNDNKEESLTAKDSLLDEINIKTSNIIEKLSTVKDNLLGGINIQTSDVTEQLAIVKDDLLSQISLQNQTQKKILNTIFWGVIVLCIIFVVHLFY